MSMTNYLEDKVLNHITGNTVFTPPSKLYIALLTAPSNDLTAGTEVVGASYKRKEVIFRASTSGTIRNNADVVFDIATESWGTVTDVAIFDALTGGNLLFYTTLSSPQNIVVDNQLIFKVDKLSITLD